MVKVTKVTTGEGKPLLGQTRHGSCEVSNSEIELKDKSRGAAEASVT